MQRILSVLLFCLACCSVCSQTITVGNGNYTLQNIPIVTASSYSYSQQIYHQSRISTGGSITKLRLNKHSVGFTANSSQWRIYMGHTSKNGFTSFSDWIPVSGLLLVFDGNVSIPETSGWFDIILDIPFLYNNLQNLVIAVDENEAGAGTETLWKSDMFPIGVTYLQYNSNTTNPDPDSPPPASESYWLTNHIQLVFENSMEIISAVTTQIPEPVIVGQTSQPVVRLNIFTGGNINPVTVNSVTFKSNGTTNTSELLAARVFYTTSEIFSSVTQIGATIQNPAEIMVFTQDIELSTANNYFWLTYDISPNATPFNVVDGTCEEFTTTEPNTYIPDPTNPAGSRIIRHALGGTVTVGIGGIYPSLTGEGGLFQEINMLALNDDLSVLIISDLSEDGTHALYEWTEIPYNSGYSLTIRPDSPFLKTISGNLDGRLIKLIGADRVIIDGRYENTGKYLKFINSNSSAVSSVIHLGSYSNDNGACNIMIRNCEIHGSGPLDTHSAISATKGNDITSNAEADNTDIQIIDNKIHSVRFGIFVKGATTGQTNLLIRDNSIGHHSYLENIGCSGIEVYNNINFNISNNIINGIVGYYAGIYGIYVNNCSNTNIDNNTIHNLRVSTNGDNEIMGIKIESLNTQSNINILNNVIYDITGTGRYQNSPRFDKIPGGIGLMSGGGYNIYNNSVNLYGNNSGYFESRTAALFIHMDIENVKVENNILANSLTTSTAYTISYAILCYSSSISVIDYNNYFVDGLWGRLGYMAGIKTTLQEWQAATGQDQHSLNVNPMYIATDDLKPSEGYFQIGKTIAGINHDIEGRIRSHPPDIGAYEGEETGRWLGGFSNDWNDPLNWDDGFVPGLDDVVIDGRAPSQPIVTSEWSQPATCIHLKILENASLTIDPGKAITVLGDMISEGLIKIKSNSEGNGSLISINGDALAEVECYMPAASWTDWREGWHFVSTPVTGQAIDLQGGWVTSGTNNDYSFYLWSEPYDTWINFNNSTHSPTFTGVNGSDYFLPARSYLVAYQQADTKTFSGELNHGDLLVSGLNITDINAANSWHLLGNPYPCALVWNNWSKTGVGATIQIWNDLLKDYSPLPQGDDAIVPSMNGFMIEVLQDNASVTIPLSARVHSNQPWFKTRGDNEKLVLTAWSADKSSGKECIIRFDEESTTDFDPELDGRYLQGYGPVFYSVANNERLSVNTLPDQNSIFEIPFVFKKNETSGYTIIADIPDHFRYIIYLVDLKNNITQSLLIENEYEFTASDKDDPDRFLLRFYPVGTPDRISDSDIHAWFENKMLYIINITDSCLVEVFDIAGRRILSKQINDSGNHGIYVDEPFGIYIVRLSNPNTCRIIKAQMLD